ncbi:MAG: TPM domain-containing protein [Candidatus Falkowbacteria bacterium]|nr:TPM domain-containing protein [Candidatus Falkowbacteria bacterium]
MKKIIVVLLCVICIGLSGQLFAQPDCSKLPSKHVPPLAVNDLAGIIDQNVQQSLEKQLCDYFNQTTIALVVVTVTSLNGQDIESYTQDLFDCWGPGGKNNAGIIFLISLKDRKVRIHTGYGIEGTLTDAACKKVISDITPLLTKGDYSSGTAKCVNEILAITGPQSWEQRMEAEKIRKEEREKMLAQSKDTVIFVSVILVLTVIIFFGVRMLLRKIKVSKLRQGIKQGIKEQEKEIQNAHKLINELKNDYEKAPSWARNEANEHMNSANNNLEIAERLLVDAQSLIIENINMADDRLIEARSLIDKAEYNFSKTNESLRQKIVTLSKKAPVVAQDAKNVLLKNIEHTQILISQGYLFNEFLIRQAELNISLKKNMEHLGDIEYAPVICRESEIIMRKSDEIIKAIDKTVQMQKEIDSNLTGKIKQATELHKKSNDLEKILNSYKEKYPKNVWRETANAFSILKEASTPEKLNSLLDSVAELNSMKNQRFSLAAKNYTDLTEMIDSTKLIYSKISEIQNLQERSRKNYNAKYSETESMVVKALNKIKDSDVSSRTKSAAKNSSVLLSKIKIEAEACLVDWLSLVNELDTIYQQAEDAYNQAENEIEKAEKERKKEAKKKAKERESSYYASSNYSSTNSDSGGLSGGFGGFGGGMSGGGGASGGF